MSIFGNIANVFKFTKSEIKDSNDKIDSFEKIYEKMENIQNLSVIKEYFGAGKHDSFVGASTNSILSDIYLSVSTNKVERLCSYREMAKFPEVSDAIDEISDESVNTNEENNVITIDVNDEIKSPYVDEIIDGANEYLDLFNFEQNLFEYMRSFVIDGQKTWENILNKEDLESGIVGIREIPPETFEYAIDITNQEKVGITVFTDNKSNVNSVDNNSKIVGGCVKVENLNTYDQIKENKAVFLPWKQITYVDSGVYSPDGLIVYPALERARKPYNQLSSVEDSIIIYRVVRAPERLVFNVDIGKMAPSKAEKKVMQLMKRYQSDQKYDSNTGTITNGYNTKQIMENFWFLKPEGSEGTSVESLAGSNNLGELEDLHFFVNKLYKSLKVPFTRYSEGNTMVEHRDSISYEEYKFAKFVIRLLNRFSKALLDGIETHLRLKGVWDENKISKKDIKVLFTPPTQFDAYERQQLLSIKMDNYNIIKDALEDMNTFSLRNYLNWDDKKIEEAWKLKEEDAIRQAKINFKVSNIEDHGEPEPVKDEEEDI